MAVNINTVYTTVLALANKEQRGYITPQEFNLFAKQAQMSIYEQYFYDLNQFKRVGGNQTNFSNVTDIIEQKLNTIFLSTEQTAITNFGEAISLGSDFYSLSNVAIRYGNGPNPNSIHPVEILSKEKADLIMSSGPLTRPTKERPIGYVQGSNLIVVPMFTYLDPSYGTSIILNKYRVPAIPRWTYFVINDTAVWNGSATDVQHFELHSSEENQLILKILQYAGISIKEVGLSQVAGQIENNEISQQKQ